MANRIVCFILISFGIVGFFLNFVLTIGGLEALINFVLKMQLQVKEGNKLFESWRKPPVDIDLKVSIFNLTNPDQIQTGSKPILQELGPYVYLETLEKVDITFDAESDTVRFRQIHTYFFQAEKSNGTPDDLVTFLNVPFLTVAKMAHLFTDSDFMLSALNEMLLDKGERLTKTHKVREFLFEGFSVKGFIELMNDPIVQASGADVKVPESIKDGKMGFFKGKNGTSDGWYVVSTGRRNPVDLTRLRSYNGQTQMNVWNSTCNSINGTDGMIYQPFQKEDTTLEIFSAAMCRSLKFTRAETIDVDGIKAYRYRMDPTVMQSVQDNPDNWCFCPSSKKNISRCPLTGLIYIGKCADDAPLYLSHPHFLFGDPSLLDGVEGLNPNPEIHHGHFDSHPRTGMSLVVKHRFQFNVHLQQWPSMETFAEVKDTILPLFWIEQTGGASDKNKMMAKLLDNIFRYWIVIGVILMVLFFVMIAIGGIMLLKAKKSNEIDLLDKKIKSSSVS